MHYLRTHLVCCAMCTTIYTPCVGTCALLYVMLVCFVCGDNLWRGLWILFGRCAFFVSNMFVCKPLRRNGETCLWGCVFCLHLVSSQLQVFVSAKSILISCWVEVICFMCANLAHSSTGAMCSHPCSHPAHLSVDTACAYLFRLPTALGFPHLGMQTCCAASHFVSVMSVMLVVSCFAFTQTWR